MTLVVMVVVGVSSALSFLSAALLVRHRPRLRGDGALIFSGCLPSLLLLLALLGGHIYWLTHGHTGYSPLAIVIYGFWFFVINLGMNFFVARRALREK